MKLNPLLSSFLFGSVILSIKGQGINFGDSGDSNAGSDSNQGNQPAATDNKQGADGTDTKFLDLGGAGIPDGLVQGGVGFVLGAAAGALFDDIKCNLFRRRRQINTPGDASSDAESVNNKFFLDKCRNPCRRRRQAGEKPGEKFFLNNNNCNGGFNGGFTNNNNGGFNGGFSNNNNGGFNGGFSNNNNGFNGGFGSNSGGFNGGFGSNNGGCQCQCDYSLGYYENGRPQGACKSADSSGRLWCYTTGYQNRCGDLRDSKRYRNNPYSNNACYNTCQG